MFLATKSRHVQTLYMTGTIDIPIQRITLFSVSRECDVDHSLWCYDQLSYESAMFDTDSAFICIHPDRRSCVI